MTERIRLDERIVGGGNYFASPKTNIEFLSTGCKLLDMALGGGWAEGRIGNVIGDKSSGKTLLMIEAAANFAIKHKNGKIKYREVEAAFDEPYAGALGMPLDRVDFGQQDIDTVEDLFEDLTEVIKKAKEPTLYIVDSLDALSDRGELERDIDAGTYGAEKAKKLSQLFRRLARGMSEHLTLLIVSQVRSKIGMTFGGGPTTTRSGGRALDFYASQVLMLSQIGTISKTIQGVKRPVGISVKGKVTKNKIALPLREAEFDIMFGYGIDDLKASLNFLKEVGSLKELRIAENAIKGIALGHMNDPDEELAQEASELVERRWQEIEESFLPKRSKYV